MIIIDFIKKNKITMIFSFIVILFSVYIRLTNISYQGFTDIDEFASYWFHVEYLKYHDLWGVQGSMWGRPTGFLIQTIVGKIFDFSPTTFLYLSAVYGIFLVIILIIIGEKNLDKNVGILSGAIGASIFTFLFFSRSQTFIMPSIFFFTISLFIFTNIVKHKRNSCIQKPYYFLISIFGFFLSITLTTHPNTIPIILVMCILFFIYEIQFLFGDGLIEISKKFILFTVFFLGVILINEYFFIFAKEAAAWSVADDVGYFYNLLFHANLPEESKSTIFFYLSALSRQGDWFAILSLIAFLFSIKKILFDKSFIAFSFLSLAIIPTFIYLITGVVAVERSIYTSLIPIILLSGWSISDILKYFFSSNSKINFLMILITITIILSTSLLHIEKLNNNLSTPLSIMEEAGGSHRVSIPTPEKSIYQWERHYFTRQDLYINNWVDVWQNYFCKDVEYLVLPPYPTDNEVYSYQSKFVKKKSHLTSYNTLYEVSYFDLDDIFDEFSNDINISSNSTKEIKNIPIKQISNGSNTFDVSPQDLNQIIVDVYNEDHLLIVEGNFSELVDTDFLYISIGDKHDPKKYGFKIVSNSKFFNNYYKLGLKDFKFSWLLNGIESNELTFNFYSFSSKNNHLKQLNNFSISKYNILEENIDLSSNCKALLNNSDKIDTYVLDFINNESNYDIIELEPGKISIPKEKIIANSNYILKFKVKKNRDSLSRVSVIFDNKYLADRTFYSIFTYWDYNEINFTTPLILDKDIIINTGTQLGEKSIYKDITLEIN